MGTEIERKFLVRGEEWRGGGRREVFRQGYLALGPPYAVRVRLAGGRGELTVKSAREGITRDEFEYAIPPADAEAMLDTLGPEGIVEKVRHFVDYAGKLWEVDEFTGANAGLVMAEVELTAEDESIEMPPWVGKEVSDDHRYFNAYLARYPYTTWDSAPGP